MICKPVENYLKICSSKEYPICTEQEAFCELANKAISDKYVSFDAERFERYMNLQRFFPFSLFPWQECIFAMNNCLYRDDGFLRFPDAFDYMGRGAGKNGFISFSSFSWISPVNGVREYNVDIFANSEDQAQTSFKEVYSVLDSNSSVMKKKFIWNKEIIKNVATQSELRFRTSGVKTKDGGKPGAIVFDEYHAYENHKLITVAETGLGKKQHPRKHIITTDGNFRDGPLDELKERARNILFKGENDLGLLPFMCKLDNVEEIHNPLNWHKANPSLRYFPFLLREIEKEYAEYKLNPAGHQDFVTKRMNLPPVITLDDVTNWDNVLATNREIPDLRGYPCVAGIDYAKTTDFVSAGLLFKVGGIYYWLEHTWVCKNSADLQRIKAPIEDWARMGKLTFVDGNEIPPEIVIDWLAEQGQKYIIKKIGMDNFRVTLFSEALRKAGFDVKNKNKVMLTKRVTVMRWAPTIQSAFARHNVVWGNSPQMRWYINNTYVDIDKDGNMSFCKKEPKSRKTDGFFAFTHAFCASEDLKDYGVKSSSKLSNYATPSYG